MATKCMNKIQEKNKKYYDTHAKHWTNVKTNSFFHEEQFRKFITYIPKNARVLDVGCAWGIHLPLFLGIGSELQYEGMDISKNMISIAKKRWPNQKFYLADITKKKTLPKKKYDAIWAAGILMHVPANEWPELFLNLGSLLKPNGVMYFTIPLGKIRADIKGDLRYFGYMKKNTVTSFLKENNWAVLYSKSIKSDKANHQWNWFIVRKI